MTMKRTPTALLTAIRILVLLAMLFSSLGGGAPRAGAAPLALLTGWMYSTIGAPVDPAFAPALALDGAGQPHALFVSGLNPALSYRVFEAGAWQDRWGSVGAARFLAVALDAEDVPHFTFTRAEGIGGVLYHVTRSGGDWVGEPLTPQTVDVQYSALALDEAGRPGVAYVNQTDNILVYAHSDGSAWQSETAATELTRHAYSHVSLALDSQDRPHIAYCYGSAAGACSVLRYTWRDATGWVSANLDTGGAYSISLALDADDRPHISYYKQNADGSSPSLAYRFYDGAAWQAQTLVTGAEGLYNQLALDSAGRARIAFYDQTGQDLEYAVSDGSAWTIDTVYDSGNAGLFPALALDAAGQPHIAFVDADEYSLKYAGQPPLPDLVVSDVWGSETGELKAAVQNAGPAPVSGWTQVKFWVDGAELGEAGQALALAPGESALFSQPWACSGEQDEARACVYQDALAEMDEANNCREVVISCDGFPPLITAGPTAGSITQTSAVISWTTSEPATSMVRYASQPGVYQNAVDAAYLSQHEVTLSGLAPNTHYAYLVRSFDSAGNRVESRQAFFRTLAAPGSTPPPLNFRAELIDPTREMYGLKVDIADPRLVQKVEFVVDGKPVGADFAGSGGLFEVGLDPAKLWPDRNLFYRSTDPHQVQVLVTGANGTLTSYPFSFSPGFSARIISGYFIVPEENRVFYIPGQTAPDRTIGILIYASQMEWSCDWATGDERNCEELEEDVEQVEFYVGADLVGTETETVRTHTYYFEWNMEGLAAGQHTLRAKIFDSDGNTREVSRRVTIQTATPTLTFERAVAREGNHFNVTLTIGNTSPVGLPVTLGKIFDSLAGFQPVNGTYGDATVSTQTWVDGINNWAQIQADQVVIQPGQSKTVQYEMVPILYQDPFALTPTIGAPYGTRIEYSVGAENYISEFFQETLSVKDASVPGGWSNIPQAVSKTRAGSDYLIITSPQRMYELTWDMLEISTLMGDLARLAILKNGVLAYWPSGGDRSALNRLLEDNSLWTNRLHANFEKRGKGYVLIVGESDVVPSFTAGPYTVDWGDGEVDLLARYSDNPYAHTDGNGAPDLLLGRIVGGNPVILDKAVRTSIRAHLGELSNDLSHVYLGSGVGIGEDMFQGDADTMETYFSTTRGMTALKQHWETSSWLFQWPMVYGSRDGFATGDLDGDGTDEVILGSRDDNRVYILNGDSGNLLSAFPLDFEIGDGLTAGDVDDDGRDEIIFADRADVVRVYEVQGDVWMAVKSFSLDWAAGDDIATGRVLMSQPGDQIVVADYSSNLLSVYNQDGALLAPAIDLGGLGYEFAAYDQLAVGNVAISALGADELLVSDYTHDKIAILGGDGALLKEMALEFAYGEMLAAGDVTDDLGDEIIVTDRDNNVYIYRGRNNNPDLAFALRTTIYKDVEEFDGLAIRELPGLDNDQVLFADRNDRVVALDALYPNAARQALRQAMPNQDLVWIFGHGSPTHIGPALDASTFALNFTGSAPIFMAFSCLTGNYEVGGNQSLVVNAFNSGAGGYFGSTEVSANSTNSNMSRKLFRNFWDYGEPFVKSILDYKNLRWEVSSYYDWWWLLANAYNYYGDPKFQLTGAAVYPAGVEREPGPAEVVVNIVQDLPAATITGVDGFDLVEIPGGDEYLEKDQPIVPTYVLTYEYPAGTSVQDVQLVARGGREEFSNLRLPLASMEQTAQLRQDGDPYAADPILTWTPDLEQPFRWRVNNQPAARSEPGGGSTLVVTIFPFRYNFSAGYAEYYRHFEFQVTTIASTVQVQSAEMSAGAYRLGEDLRLHLALANGGDPVDGIVSAAVYAAGSAEPVSGFPLHFLPGFSGAGVADLALSSAGLPAGEYSARVEVYDTQGQLLDWREVSFHLGISEGQLSGLAPLQTLFRPGDRVTFTAQVHNTGDLPLKARLVLAVGAAGGSYQFSETRELAEIPAGGSVPFSFTWDSTGAPQGDYHFSAYLEYDSQASAAAMAEMTTGKALFLPMIRK